MSQKLYPVMDRVNLAEKKARGIPTDKLVEPLPSEANGAGGVRAILTGEFRAPKKGEWYLSGAIPEAYRADNDFANKNKYHIARLVRTETKTVQITTIIKS